MTPALRPFRFVAALCLLVAAGVAVAGSPTLERIRQSGTIVLGYRDGAAPFSFRDRDGRVLGYSVEMCARAAAHIQKQLGLAQLKIEWTPLDAANRLDAVAAGRVDAECGTTTITLTRMEQVDFSVPIYVDGGAIMVRKRARLNRLADLKGRKVAVIAGTTTEQAVVTALNAADARGAVLVPVKDGAAGLAELLSGRVDGYASDRIVLTSLRERAPVPRDLEFIAGDISYEPYAIVVRRDDPDFRLALNRGLVAMYKNGDIDIVFQRWFSSLGKPGTLLNSMFYLNSLPE
jgi:ABC-type amino acid transport substrate-binding protein